MALFNKKKSQTPVAPTTAPASSPDSGDDFSDFSPEALAAPGVADAKGGAAKADKKSGTGRGVKPGTAIGLNIGADSIKVVEATSKGSGITITAMGMIHTPPDSIDNGVVLNANALALGIRDAMAQAGIKSKKVVTSISGTGALVVRIIEVPKMSDAELLDNMKMDADRYIPFPPSEVEMDFKALRDLPSDPDSPNMEVLLAAGQREVIDAHVEVIQDAKLDPRAIDVEPLATARALTHPLTTKAPGEQLNGAANIDEVDYSDVSTVLNIGASGTEISILRGDLLVFTRTVPTGGKAMTQALVDTLGLAWTDAEHLKREMGDALPPPAGPDMSAGAAVSTPGADSISSDDDWSSFAEDANAPLQTEPGEQHQQKEADKPGQDDASTPDAKPAGPGAFFDFGDESEPEDKLPTVKEDRPTSYTDLLGQEEDDFSELPTLTPDAPPLSPLPSAFAFPGETKPATPAPVKPAAPAPVAFEDNEADLPTLQSTPASTDAGATDESDAALPSAASFAFSFDDAAPAAPPKMEAAGAAPEAKSDGTSDFDFGFETPAQTEAEAPPAPAAPVESDPFAEFMASAEAEAPPAKPVSTPAATQATDDFDIDDLFKDDNAAAAGSVTSGAAMDASDLDLGEFDLDSGTTDFSADLADFGAGLGAAAAGEIDAATLHGALEPVLETLVNEVRRSLEYHTTRYPDAAVRRITIVGGGAKLKNIDAFLTQKLGLPATIGNPALQLRQNAPKLPPGYIEENGTVFTVALGLAMRELTK